MPVSVGQLRHRVTLRRLTRSNVDGVEVSAWTIVAPSRQPAHVETIGSARDERIFAGQAGGVVEGVQLHTVTLRGPQTVLMTDQVVWHTGRAQAPPDEYPELLAGDRVFRVTSVRSEGAQDAWAVLSCEERER